MSFKFSRLPSREINLVRKSGRTLSASGILLVYRLNSTGVNRITIIVPKSVTKLATARNRTRRILREAINQAMNINRPVDLIVSARSDLSGGSAREMLPVIRGLLEKII